MSHEDVRILRDREGNPIPQYYDAVEDEMKPITKDNYPEIQTIEGSIDVVQLNDLQSQVEDIKNEIEAYGVEVIKQHNQFVNGTYYFGETAGTSRNHLDVSKYNEKSIYIGNESDGYPLYINRITFTSHESAPVLTISDFREFGFPSQRITAVEGSSMLLMHDRIPYLKDYPITGISIEIEAQDEVYVRFSGRRDK